MTIYGVEKGLDPVLYEAKRIENGEAVYGLAVIKVNEEKSYLIQLFETDDFTDGVPARAHYVTVQTNSVSLIEEDKDNCCQNCEQCKCFSCEYREGGNGCVGRCYDCGDKPIEKCDTFKYANW